MSNVRSSNKQLAINMGASFVTFIVGFGISFFLTPYIVEHLGASAYGFVGLSNNIISYTTLLTVALNSMAGRFITISYTQGKIDEANRYFSSVFYSNLILSGIIFILMGGCVVYMENMFEIPAELVADVKILFAFLAVNSILTLLTNIYAIATFIKNRLELSSIRQIIGNVLKGILTIFLFGCFAPKLWYVGLTGMVVTLYTAYTNYRYTQFLTPELKVERSFYDWKKTKELIKSGAWNTLSKLGSILGQGLDLLIANICISATIMGYFAITKNVPFLILGLFSMVSGVFAPSFTTLYAQGKYEDLLHEFNKSIRILSMLTAVPLTCLYIFGDYFYALWMPNENSFELQKLTILGTFALPFTMPLESLWNIFTITNKLKYSTIFSLVDSLVVFAIVMSSMLVVDDLHIRLIILASTRSLCGIIRGFLFLPIYGAHCLDLSYSTFYKVICKSLSNTAICICLCYLVRLIFIPDNWIKLALAALFVCVICLIVSIFIILNKSDRKFLCSKLKRRSL